MYYYVAILWVKHNKFFCIKKYLRLAVNGIMKIGNTLYYKVPYNQFT